MIDLSANEVRSTQRGGPWAGHLSSFMVSAGSWIRIRFVALLSGGNLCVLSRSSAGIMCRSGSAEN